MEIKNYRIFITSNSLMSFASGLLGPFYVVFVEEFAGLEIFGFAMGSGIISSIVIFSYTLISSILLRVAFLGDITKRETRGKYIGLYHTLLGMASGIAMIIAGFIVAKIGLKIIFYLTASLTFVSSLILLGIKE